MASAGSPNRARVNTNERLTITDGWQAAPADHGQCQDPSGLQQLDWLPARVPGTAAAVLQDAGRWRLGEPHDFDAQDWWFRTNFQAKPLAGAEEAALCLDGVATVAEVYLNGELILNSESMFIAHTLDVTALLRERNELVIRCVALAELLKPRRRPRARWRTRLVGDGNLRFFRTMLLGRAPGFALGPAAVGPWREVRLERRRRLVLESLELRPRLVGKDGVLAIQARLRPLAGTSLERISAEVDGPNGVHRTELDLSESAEGKIAHGQLEIPNVERWWPHTHGEPSLHRLRLRVCSAGSSVEIDAGSVGFRELAAGPGAESRIESEGLHLHVNGVPVFARGALWTPLELAAPHADTTRLRTALEQVRNAGMNMLRIPGTSVYESQAFFDLCDELGILVWQDFMFANLDYPLADPAFRALVEREAGEALDGLAGRPSLAVLCGNSEIEQQVAMLGLDPELGRGELFGELLPGLIERSGADAIYVPSAPCGGELPFRPDRGIANYYGVGGYRRPLVEIKSAGVRFAAECLAFSNVPDQCSLDEMFADQPLSAVAHHPRWKAGVPRDVGAGWDFEDVRDHYLKELFGVDPPELRAYDHARYLELSRILSGEVMAEVFGEWRRGKSVCGGGLVLWLRDLYPGAGWGLVDQAGRPKVAYHYLRRLLAPVAVWITDEGLAGARVHTANDRLERWRGELRLALYGDFEHCVQELTQPLELEPGSVREHDLEGLLGHFLDASWAYRFGPPAQNMIVASLRTQSPTTGDVKLASQAMRFVAGYPIERSDPERVGLRARASSEPDGSARLELSSRRLAWAVRVELPGFHPEDDAFSLEPGVQRVLKLRALDSESRLTSGTVSAANLRGTVKVAIDTDAG